MLKPRAIAPNPSVNKLPGPEKDFARVSAALKQELFRSLAGTCPHTLK